MPISDKAYLAKYLKPSSSERGASGGSSSWMEEKKRKIEKEAKIIIPKSYGRADSDEEGDEEDEIQSMREEGKSSNISESLENQLLKRKRHDSDDDEEKGDDLSPPNRGSMPSSRNEPPKRRHDSDDDDGDLSPPRPSTEKKRRHDSDDDLSPVRESAATSATARRRHDSDDDGDLSPVRRSTNVEKPSTTETLKIQNEKSENQTVYRHPETKKIISFEEYSELMKKKKRQTTKITQNEITWAKGLKQQEERQNIQSEYDALKTGEYKGIYESDASYKQHFRDKLKEEDPMAKLITEKKKMQQESQKTSKNKKIYDGSFPENRFNIKPGWRWDGVDRSNGFENQYFKHMNNVKNREDREFLWSNAGL